MKDRKVVLNICERCEDETDMALRLKNGEWVCDFCYKELCTSNNESNML